MFHTHSSSGVSSPDSWHGSNNSHNSDTTPSPSGHRAPAPDPHALSSKLALYEASKSLSFAAETLATAARAMSKAAASLAVASGNLATENACTKSRVPVYQFEFGGLSPVPGSWSPVWQQSSYALPAKHVVVENAPSDAIGEAESVPLSNLRANQAPATDDRSLPANRKTEYPDGFPRATPIFEPGPTSSRADASPPQTECTSLALAGVDESASTIVPSTSEPTKHENKSAVDQHASVIDVELEYPQTNQSHALVTNLSVNTNITNNDEVIDLTSPSEPDPIHTEPASFDAAIQPKSHFRLTRAFDELPAVAFLSRQYPKSICFYKYWDAAQSLMDTAITAPSSFKFKQLTKAITDFLNCSESVLLWPSHIALPQIATLASKADTQAIHIGHVSTVNNGVNFTRVFVVTTEKWMSTMTQKKGNDLVQEYPLSALNSDFNQPGDTSILNPYRLALRASLAGDSLTPSLYKLTKAFISHHRVYNTAWSAHEVAKRANEFAQDFLLRGEQEALGETVGGRIRLKQAEVKKWKLEPAVQSGALLVDL